MIIANTPQSHPDCPSKSEISYFIKFKEQKKILSATIKTWQTDHKLQSGKVTFWDYHFQTPDSTNIDATQPSIFNVADNQKLEIYEFPGRLCAKI